tara:strand:+ start:357 stop:632 length:276 start_codon:yes stop_codon:yes gene_type:complete
MSNIFYFGEDKDKNLFSKCNDDEIQIIKTLNEHNKLIDVTLEFFNFNSHSSVEKFIQQKNMNNDLIESFLTGKISVIKGFTGEKKRKEEES